MEKGELVKLIQGYMGMTPKDKGCSNWSEMQDKMANEIMAKNLKTKQNKSYK